MQLESESSSRKKGPTTRKTRITPSLRRFKVSGLNRTCHFKVKGLLEITPTVSVSLYPPPLAVLKVRLQFNSIPVSPPLAVLKLRLQFNSIPVSLPLGCIEITPTV